MLVRSNSWGGSMRDRVEIGMIALSRLADVLVVISVVCDCYSLYSFSFLCMVWISAFWVSTLLSFVSTMRW
jgi:hypothetical protein